MAPRGEPRRPADVSSPAAVVQGAGLGSGVTADIPAREPRFVVPAIDGFRGLAALAVVLYHVSYGSGLPRLGGLGSVFMSGYMGVDFFFVISGFVLFLPTVIGAGRFGDLRAYGLRRAARIIPAYYVALLAALALQSVLHAKTTPLPWNSLGGAGSFVLHLSFLQHSVGLARGYAEGFVVLGVVWTLAIEVSFYVLLPLVARWYYRHPLVGLAIALVASQLWKMWAVDASFSVWFLPATTDPGMLRLILVTQIPTFFGHFAADMTAAWLFVRWRRADLAWVPKVAIAAQVVSVVVIVWLMRAAGLRDLAGTAGTYDHWTRTLPVALAFAVLVLATVMAPKRAQVPVTNPASRWLGDVSYGVYLWHLMVIGFALTSLHFAPDATTWAFLRMLGFTLTVSLLIAWASLTWVERPAIRWARRRSRVLEARADAGPPPVSRPLSALSGTDAPD